MGANSMITSTSLSADSRLYGSFLSPPQYIRSLDDDRFPPNHDKQYMGYCITKKSLCDGIMNCEDRKDEDISHCQAFIDMEDPNSPLLANDDLIDVNSWLSGLLSLGMPASIAIAVSTIVILILGIGVVICCCHRCCLINQTYNQYSNNRLAFRNGGIFLDTFSRPITAANNNYSYSRSQHLGVMSVNAGAQSQLSDRIDLISHIDGDQQKISRNWQQSASFLSDILMTRGGSFSRRNCNEPNQHHQTFNQYLTSSQNMTTEKESRLHCFTKTPLKLPLLDRYYPLLNPPNETMRSQYFVSVGHHGSDSYSLTNNNSARVYDLQNGQPGPLPALIHGALGSPCTYRRDPLYYTPPPHGAFNVPPASIVTASSSRTGTTSGGPRESVKSGRDQSVPTMGYNTSGNGSGIGICNQQLDGVESVLHTNTPIESISHGGDLSLNGGILYSGNMYRPLSPQNSSLFQVENLGRSSVTTTGSGSSCDRKSHHYFLREIKSHHDDTEAYLQRNPHQQSTYDLFKKSSRRSKTSSRLQHHHHLKYKSIDPNHTISIGSHTSASSRSGALLNLPQLTYDAHEQPFSRFLISAVTTISSDTGPSNHQPIVFPVQL
ncbi:unnamed protein product [Schistosoma haematobium]|nr:unnamed protein product [Schistosoma haematobium]